MQKRMAVLGVQFVGAAQQAVAAELLPPHFQPQFAGEVGVQCNLPCLPAIG